MDSMERDYVRYSRTEQAAGTLLAAFEKFKQDADPNIASRELSEAEGLRVRLEKLREHIQAVWN